MKKFVTAMLLGLGLVFAVSLANAKMATTAPTSTTAPATAPVSTVK